MTELICIVCPKGCHLKVDEENNCAVTGNGCPRGAEYGKIELTSPTRVLTSTVRCTGGALPRCPVKTDRPIPKPLMFDAMRVLDGIHLQAPIRSGQIVAENICNTGANFVATRSL
ncbi:MAG: DUF1667 domain-containing protein [Oscillospiraceae bacterium]